jgi:hypothetical protein
MGRVLLVCAIIAGLVAAGIVINLKFSPTASYAQPAPASPNPP